MRRVYLLTVGKVMLAGLIIAAISVQVRHGLETQPNFQLVNFFSFFTIESNLLAATTLLVSALTLVRRTRDRQLDYLRGGVTLYMLLTGIIYVLLLARADVQTPLPWVNAVLHYIAPLLIVADWIVDPASRPISNRRAMVWLLFPLGYLLYSLVRGPMMAHWYPYDFINVYKFGLGHVLLNSLFIGAVTAVLAALVAALSSRPQAQTQLKRPRR